MRGLFSWLCSVLSGCCGISSATGDGKPGMRRLKQPGIPIAMKSATATAGWRYWPGIGMPAVCSASPTPTCSRIIHPSNRSSRAASEWPFTGIIIRRGTVRCSTTNNGRSAVQSISSKRGKYTASSFSRRA